MAPKRLNGNGPTHAGLARADEQMKSIVQNLYNLIIQGYSHQGVATESAMQRQIQQLVEALIALRDVTPSITEQVPRELVEYVQRGRNPDIYTREFVEIVMDMNQRLKGKTESFAAFRDALAEEMIAGIDGMKGDVRAFMQKREGETGVK